MIKKWLEYITESFKKMSYTKEDIYEYTLKSLNDKIESLFSEIHQKFDTESGDITPNQKFELDDIQNKLARLVSQQVHQNLGKDFNKIKSSDIDISELKELSDERDSVVEGDEVIAVYFDGGYSIYKYEAKMLHYTMGRDGKLGYRNKDLKKYTSEIFYIKDAYLVVKVSTYNDFVSPDKRV